MSPKQHLAVVADSAIESAARAALDSDFAIQSLDVREAVTALASPGSGIDACLVDADLRIGAEGSFLEWLVRAHPALPVLATAAEIDREKIQAASRLGVPLLVPPLRGQDIVLALSVLRRRAFALVQAELQSEFDATILEAGLTDQQRSVSLMIVLGAVSKEIANYLALNVRTVEAHRRDALRKLRLASMDDLRWRVLGRVLPDWRKKK